MSNASKPANAERTPNLLACSGSLDGGGSERQLWQFVSRLDRQRYHPDVYLQYRRGLYLDKLPTDVKVSAFSDRFPNPSRLWPGRIFRLQIRDLRQAAAKLNSDIVYDRTYHMSLITGLAFPARSIPRVSVIVSPPSRDFLQTEKKFRACKRWLLSRSYRRAASVIAVSDEVADDAARFYQLDRNKILVLPNPIDIANVTEAAHLEKPFSQQAVVRHDATIVVVGRMSAEKGQAFALRVLSRLRSDKSAPCNVYLHLIGDGPDRSQLEQLAVELGVREHVSFHGYQANPYPWMHEADLVFIPSNYEGFPNVALEALAIGTPLMLTNFGSNARYIASPHCERAEIVERGDEQAAVAAIHDCIAHRDKWLKRAAQGKLWVASEHALDAWLSKMQDHLDDVRRKWHGNWRHHWRTA